MSKDAMETPVPRTLMDVLAEDDRKLKEESNRIENIEAEAVRTSLQKKDEKKEEPEEKEKPEPEDKKQPSKEELEADREEIMERFFPTHSRKKEPQKEPEKKDEDEKAEEKTEDKPEEKEGEPKPKPEKKPQRKVDVPPHVSERTKEIIDSSSEEPEREEKKPQDDGRSKTETDMLEACALLESQKSEYKGLKARVASFWKKEQDYISKWQEENPEGQFNASDEEHAAFYSKNEPPIDEDDLQSALIEVKAERVAERKMREIDKRAEEMDARTAMASVEPVASLNVRSAIGLMINDASPEFGKLLKKTGDGQFLIDKEVSDKMEELDPAAKEILQEETEPMSLVIRELTMLDKLGGKHKFDAGMYYRLRRTDGDFRPHAKIGEIAEDLERELSGMDPKETLRDGKRFCTHADFTSAVRKIRESKISESDKKRSIEKLVGSYYTIDYTDLQAATIAYYAGRAKSRLERLSRRPSSASKKTQEDEEKKVEEPEKKPVKSQKTKAPAVEGSSDVLDSAKGKGVKGGLDEKMLDQKMGWA